MVIALTTLRDRLDPTTTFTSPLFVDEWSETNTSEERSIFFPLRTYIEPNSFTAIGTVTNGEGSSTVTTTGGGFSNVRVGDLVSGTDIPNSSVVISVASDNNSFTMNTNATDSGSVTLTFSPPESSAAVCAIKIIFTEKGKNIVPTCRLYTYDGSLNNGYGNEENYTTVSDLLLSPPVSINMDDFLSKVRVQRT